ncbi:polysaccharide biosynthesis protein, partial [Vibrio alfacsensis]
PNLSDIVSGELQIDQLKEVAIEDLLGRDQVAPNQALLEKNIKKKTVMVTGAGGSIGSELCRQIIKHNPGKLVLFEASEYSLYSIER